MPLKGDDLVQLRFIQKIEMDTVSCELKSKISEVWFCSYKRSKPDGEKMGYKFLFRVKF